MDAYSTGLDSDMTANLSDYHRLLTPLKNYTGVYHAFGAQGPTKLMLHLRDEPEQATYSHHHV